MCVLDSPANYRLKERERELRINLFQQIFCSVVYSNLEHSPPPGEIVYERNRNRNRNRSSRAVDGTAEERDVVKKEKATSHSWTWIKVVASFLAGLVIGELKIGRRRNGDGYITIV